MLSFRGSSRHASICDTLLITGDPEARTERRQLATASSVSLRKDGLKLESLIPSLESKMRKISFMLGIPLRHSKSESTPSSWIATSSEVDPRSYSTLEIANTKVGDCHFEFCCLSHGQFDLHLREKNHHHHFSTKNLLNKLISYKCTLRTALKILPLMIPAYNIILVWLLTSTPYPS